ncbi:rod-determining factor RdfA [Halopelagius longus]|uniref:Uncharacterized protein n=1 Tax=Halopelagius longus TaxID=1236180 RepID=A0A1H1GN16_9EURY|nr:rod-determining factor RdfA [Halopelagius longus]RDI69659.1 hypothetical protein DWB78_17975 [Halopelagius longus]SDR14276.1 hypothetical protein SAMN05216278_3763 [Halopelagius longus]
MTDEAASLRGPSPRVHCGCKVGSVADRYGLGDVSRELGVLWTTDEEDRYSLRELADHFNQRVVESAMFDAGMNPLEGEVENVYRLLTDEESSAGHRVQAENRLEFEGVSVAEVRDDFVTHQTVYRHLKNCLEAEYERETGPSSRVERDVDRIEALRNRIRVIVDETVRRLCDAGLFSITSPSAYVEIRILCEECGARYSPRELLERDRCDCPVELDR